jgi:hypothetical protein
MPIPQLVPIPARLAAVLAGVLLLAGCAGTEAPTGPSRPRLTPSQLAGPRLDESRAAAELELSLLCSSPQSPDVQAACDRAAACIEQTGNDFPQSCLASVDIAIYEAQRQKQEEERQKECGEADRAMAFCALGTLVCSLEPSHLTCIAAGLACNEAYEQLRECRSQP